MGIQIALRQEGMVEKTKFYFLMGLVSFMLSACGGGGSSTSSSNPPEGTTSSITLSWETPVSLADGRPLADLSGFNIYYGKSPLGYSEVIDTGDVRTYTLQNMPAGTYYFAITAYDSAGNETDFSPEVKKSIP
jgi:hypothetical protein